MRSIGRYEGPGFTRRANDIQRVIRRHSAQLFTRAQTTTRDAMFACFTPCGSAFSHHAAPLPRAGDTEAERESRTATRPNGTRRRRTSSSCTDRAFRACSPSSCGYAARDSTHTHTPTFHPAIPAPAQVQCHAVAERAPGFQTQMVRSVPAAFLLAGLAMCPPSPRFFHEHAPPPFPSLPY
jgi:hypothetical protein